MNVRQFGAQLLEDEHCRWRVWAPSAESVELVLFDSQDRETAAHRMQGPAGGFFEHVLPDIAPGQLYAFRLDGKSPRPDPASRSQPAGVHRPSAVWHENAVDWTDRSWRGIARKDLVIYELHAGTFTPEGTFAAIVPRLGALRDLGVTAIELMPVGQFPGDRGWGYDGVYWFAVQQSYGGATELQRFVNACHHAGLGVILDVIYNHLGPEGNYLGEFGPFFTDRHHTPWGAAVNFDGPTAGPVREFVLENVRHWIRDFHIDGLRLDAVHAMHDESPTHILGEIKYVAVQEAARFGRPVQIIAESNLNDVRLLDAPSVGGYGLDAQWSDDFHHCVHALLTGERSGYYSDFPAPALQLVKALNDVFVYDGCFSPYRGAKHGAPVGEHTGEPFVVSIQTHDQVGNRAVGDRFGTLLDPAQQRLAAGLLLLAPHIPLLFMGEEYGETRPFPFFCDFQDAALREAVRCGRRQEFSEFGWSGELPDPMARETFESAILSWSWPAGSIHDGLRTLYGELLALRRTQPALQDFRLTSAQLLPGDGDSEVLWLERGDSSAPERCLFALFNLRDKAAPIPSILEPTCRALLSSDDVRFGGARTACPGIAPLVVTALGPFEFAVFGNRLQDIPEVAT